MKFSTAIAVTAATYASAEELTRCGNVDPPEDLKSKLNNAVEMFTSGRANGSTAAGGSVDTYVHVVSTSAKADSYSQQQVNEQVSLSDPATLTIQSSRSRTRSAS